MKSLHEMKLAFIKNNGFSSSSSRNLRDMDVFSKSDPMCVIFLRPFGSKAWAEAARTEAIQNTLNPDFTRKVKLNWDRFAGTRKDSTSAASSFSWSWSIRCVLFTPSWVSE